APERLSREHPCVEQQHVQLDALQPARERGDGTRIGHVDPAFHPGTGGRQRVPRIAADGDHLVAAIEVVTGKREADAAVGTGDEYGPHVTECRVKGPVPAARGRGRATSGWDRPARPMPARLHWWSPGAWSLRRARPPVRCRARCRRGRRWAACPGLAG